MSRAQEEDESLCSNWDCCGKHRDRENGCWGYSEILRTPFDRSPRKGGSQKGALQPRFPGGDIFFEYFLWRAPKPRFDLSPPKNLSSFVRIHHRKGLLERRFRESQATTIHNMFDFDGTAIQMTMTFCSPPFNDKLVCNNNDEE